ncbi:TrbI/VirB10 family protein [Salmonella enterica]|nr:TrbI/VirB10 family protein [Salmonella enterica]EEP3373114.1 TrbI/VirB10 family protein [Salmonella enterica]EFP6579674.1 TrbI/VirB10 family protein [Salmonella enterica]EGC7971441.1 TrbI/VirB10 family protein [Salmonella enterica]EIV4461666.1 TrbI/VirB10 family protein [Salmonella enterica]
MSNKEIDPLAELEREQSKIDNSAERRKIKGGGNKVVSAAALALAVICAGSYFIYMNLRKPEQEAQTAPVVPAHEKSGRKFNVQTQPVEPPAPVEVKTEQTVQPAAKVEDAKPDVVLDKDGLTPEQAAMKRRLVSGFGGGDDGEASQQSSASGEPDLSDKDNELSKSLSSIKTVTVKATAKKSLDLILTRGNTIPCALDRNIDSNVPGQLSCHTIQDVYSSSGKVLLMERNTKINGSYQAGVAQGQTRIFATWDRIETPKGVFMQISTPAVGAMGEAGIDGVLDTQFGTRFYNTILLSSIQDVVSNAATHLAKSNTNGNSVSVDNTTQAANDIAVETLKNSINIPNVIRKNIGEIVGVDVMQDMDFSSVYKIESN